MNKLLGLSGDYVEAAELPAACPRCSCKEFYKQKDFKRSIGLSVVFSASAVTCLLFFQRREWLVVWSPMLVALLIDRFFAHRSSDAVLCYDCGLIFRGLKQSQIDPLPPFDLETFDRYQYPKRTGESLD